MTKPDAVVLPKTAKVSRLAGNLAAAELTLSAEDILIVATAIQERIAGHRGRGDSKVGRANALPGC